MNQNFKLTIAIPTYNRCELLKQTLDSVLTQIKNNELLEIIVVDNASTDNTEDMMQRYPSVKYIKNEVNKGIDFNINKCVFEASGEYVHILSDDDLLIDGALDKIISIINNDVDFAFLNGVVFHNIFDDNVLKNGNKIFLNQDDYYYTDMNQFLLNIWVWATFVSSFVVKREKWIHNKKLDSYVGTDILLSYALIDLLNISKKVMIVGMPCIAIRAAYSGNYRIIYAFSYQWKKLLLEYAPTLGFDLIIMEKIFKKSVLKDLFPRLLKISIKNRIDKTSKEYEYLSYGIDNFWFGSFIKFVISKFSIFNLRIVNKVFNIFKISNLNTIIKEQK